MDITILLARAGAHSSGGLTINPEVIWQYITGLELAEALMFISFGSVCLFYGWRVFKILVTICFGLIGLILSVQANKYLIGGNVVWLSMIMVTFFVIISIPLMRWGVSLLGALAGGIITSGLWMAIGLPQQYFWAGGLVGLIAGGMISFIIFKVAVILFTSLGGSSLIVIGILGVLYRNLPNPERLEELVYSFKWFPPILLLFPMTLGMFLQYRFIKKSPEVLK